MKRATWALIPALESPIAKFDIQTGGHMSVQERRSVEKWRSTPLWRTGDRSMQPCSTHVTSYRITVSNLVPPPEGTAKWRFGPSINRHLPPF
jgi:hypothetical protein